MPSTTTPVPQDDRDRAVVFSGLWALAHVGHVLRKGQPTEPIAWLILLAALLVLMRASAFWRTGALAAAQLLFLSPGRCARSSLSCPI